MFRLMITPLYQPAGGMPTSSIMQQVKHIHIDKLLSLLTFPRKPFRNRSINRGACVSVANYRFRWDKPCLLSCKLSSYIGMIIFKTLYRYTKGLVYLHRGEKNRSPPSDVVARKEEQYFCAGWQLRYSLPKSKQGLLTDKYLSNSTPYVVICHLSESLLIEG